MIMTIGIDNTNTVIGCFDGDKIQFTARIATERKKTDVEYAISLRNILDLYGIPMDAIEGSIIACVVPVLLSAMKGALQLLFHKEPLVVGPGVKTGLTIVSDNMVTLGSDLVAMVAGAVAEYQAPMVVIGLGTATVLLAVDEKKRFIGSVIAPGVLISAQALAEKCDNLPQISLEAPKEIVGKKTSDSMQAGIIYGTAAMLDGMTARIEQKIGTECRVIATGSHSDLIIPHCRREIHTDKLLLLKGLYRIYCRNARK